MLVDSGVNSAGSAERSRSPIPRGWPLSALAGALVVVAAGGFAWWRIHPDESFVGGYGMSSQRLVGEPMWTVLLHWNQATEDGVTFTSIEPQFRVNSSEATVEYILCELDPEAARGDTTFGYGMHAGRVDTVCASTRPAEGARFELRDDVHEELLVGVTPTRPGRVVITGHRLSFDAGWQRRSDEIGLHIRIVTPMKMRSPRRH